MLTGPFFNDEDHCVDAKSFLDALSPINPRWQNPPRWLSSDWRFRGQGDHKWQLQPRAFRDSHILDYKNSSPLVRPQLRKIVGDFWDKHSATLKRLGNLRRELNEVNLERSVEVLFQIDAEQKLINEFIYLCDNLGFETLGQKFDDDVINNGIVYRAILSELTGDYDYLANFNLATWARPSVALAQHHGIPTRLLDWTTNAHKAAFFAVEGIDNAELPEYIAVYAIHRDWFKQHIKEVGIPRSQIAYLHAQDGIFTIDTRLEENYFKYGRYLSLDESLLETEYPRGIDIQATRFLLKYSAVGELLRLLSLERITRAHLQPSYDNVTLTLRAKWDYKLGL